MTSPLVLAYVEAHGRPYTPAPRPKGVRKRADKACFLNALNYVCQYPGHRYVEGVADLVVGDREVPMHHAWVVRDGSTDVIDVTWPEPGARYVGVEFTPKKVASLASGRQSWGGALPILVGAAAP